jgi:hypothetical protein
MVFWALNIPPVVILYFVVSNEVFQVIMLIYLAVVSIYANFANHWVGWIAARTRRESNSGD